MRTIAFLLLAGVAACADAVTGTTPAPGPLPRLSPNLEAALTGRTQGVQITTLAGGPIRIRIDCGWAIDPASHPLWVVNGRLGDTVGLRAADIVSVSVMKGPSAVAAYGPGGENGAVIITTR